MEDPVQHAEAANQMANGRKAGSELETSKLISIDLEVGGDRQWSAGSYPRIK